MNLNNLIDNILQNYTPLHVTYNNKTTILYVAKINNMIYINTNSVALPGYGINRWNRTKSVSDLIKELDIKYEPLKSVCSLKNKGTWIHYDLCENYFNWFGLNYKKLYDNYESYISFGTYICENIEEVLEEYPNTRDLYFMKVKSETNYHNIRANRENNFINLTDLLEINGKDIRSWKKTNSFNNYNELNPSHCLNGNSVLDEFGIKCTYGHPQLALLLIDWIYKDSCVLKEKLIKFVNIHLKIISKEELGLEDSFTEDFIEPQETKKDTEFIPEDGIVNIEVVNELTVEKKEEPKEIDIYKLQLTNDQEIDLLILKENGYINLTKLCEINNKKIKNWKSTVCY